MLGIIFVHFFSVFLYISATPDVTTHRQEISGGFYIAAVSEHEIFMGTQDSSPDELLDANINIYEEQIALAKEKGAQILVFPEFGLTAVNSNNASRADLYPFAERIPESSDKINPCFNSDYKTSPILYRISCAAQKYSLTVLVNTIDWIDCDVTVDSNCPADGHYQYNTDVVFDETGLLVAKYHKSHEWPPFIGAYDQAPEITHVTYTSSFGVTFGLFICYDIVFPDPAKVLRSEGIAHFLYSVAQGKAGLDTIMPLWSKNEEAVLLASNLGFDCSGILINGVLVLADKYFVSSKYDARNNILVASIPV